jgi:hypothetical protein
MERAAKLDAMTELRDASHDRQAGGIDTQPQEDLESLTNSHVICKALIDSNQSRVITASKAKQAECHFPGGKWIRRRSGRQSVPFLF